MPMQKHINISSSIMTCCLAAAELKSMLYIFFVDMLFIFISCCQMYVFSAFTNLQTNFLQTIEGIQNATAIQLDAMDYGRLSEYVSQVQFAHCYLRVPGSFKF